MSIRTAFRFVAILTTGAVLFLPNGGVPAASGGTTDNQGSWAPSAGESVAFDEEELTTILEDAREEMKAPGLRAAVRMADGRIVRAAVGFSDAEAEVLLDNEIGMPGGSTGKMFVAALTMLLVEDGVLSLDDPASKWLGDTDWYHRLPNAEQIRVRHLLSHTAGIPDYHDSTQLKLAFIWRVIRHGSAFFEPEELIGYMLDREPLFPAGEGYYYTDVGYLVLGRLIEAASGSTYYELLDERILKPQGLNQVRPADQAVLPDTAVGYAAGARNRKKDGRTKYDPRSEWTGGGLVTNPTMLAEFLGALAEGRIVSEVSLGQMLEGGGWSGVGPRGFRYGLGLFVHDRSRSFGHSGLWPGYRSHVAHYQRTGITIAVQTNRDGPLDMEGLVHRISIEAR